MTSRFLIAGAAGLLLVGLSLTAAAKEMTAKAFMKAVNRDADNTISKDELDAFAKKKFAELERDKDGTLDKTELKGRLSAAGMKAANTDKDETLDEAEFVGYADRLFDEANKKGDTTLDVQELRSPAGRKLRTLLH